jgi:hypothetical protein
MLYEATAKMPAIRAPGTNSKIAGRYTSRRPDIGTSNRFEADHPDPKMRGKIIKFPEPLKQADNEIFVSYEGIVARIVISL